MDTKKLKQKVLDLAIRGKLVPQDPNDEPASKLLERIYAEKQKLISEGKIKKEKRTSFIFKGEDNSYYEKVEENGKETIRDITAEIPFDIPETWAWTRLGSVSNYGYVVPVSPENIPDNAWILELEDIEKDSGKILCYVVKRERFAKSSKNQFHTEDILYSKLRPYLNKVVFAEKDGFCSSEILPIKFCKSILPKYAYYYLKTSFFLSYANNSSYGVKMPRLGTETGRNALFPIPPLTEQQKIIKSVNLLLEEVLLIEENFGKLFQQVVLSKSKLLDLAIRGKLLPQNPNDEPAAVLLERIRKEQESTKTKRKSIGSYIFKGEDNLYYRKTKDGIELIDDELPFKVPENWQWAQISDVCVLYTGNSIPKEVKAKKYANVSSGYNYIGTKDVGYNSQIDYENGVKIPLDEPKFKVAPTNSILLCIEGGNAGRKMAITKENVCFGNKLCCFIVKGISYCFLYDYLQSSIFKELFYGSLMGLIGGVGTSSLEKIYIPIPPLQEQERISEFLTSAFYQLDSLIQH